MKTAEDSVPHCGGAKQGANNSGLMTLDSGLRAAVGVEAKSKEFTEKGAELYAKV